MKNPAQIKKKIKGKKDDAGFPLGEFEAFVELEVNGQQYLLVHAGINNFSPEKDTPTQLISGNPRPGYIFKANNHIAMDCGACSPKGRLAGICLETGEEFYSR